MSLLYAVFTHLAAAASVVGGATTVIILGTCAVRLALLPLTLRAVRAERTRARLAPRVAALREKHAKRPDRLAEELSALYRKEGTSVLAGFGPMLLQAPAFLLLSRLFYSGRMAGYTLFGTPLAARFAAHPYPLFGLLAAVLVALAVWSSARAGRIARVVETPPHYRVLGRVMPFATVVTASFLPLAVGLYLATSTAWTLVESTLLRRGLPPAG